MEKIDPLYLTSNDLLELKKKELGHGTDGYVFKYGNNKLIKIYHMSLQLLENMNYLLKQETKVFDKNNYQQKKMEEIINYYQYTDEDIKLRSKDAIYKAIEKQSKIKRTRLPQNVVFIDGMFAGCILSKSKGIQIHKLTGMPLEIKKAILLDLIESLKELYENYIYHVDLANSPYSSKSIFNNNGILENVGHSHILVELLKRKTNIIDLEGKSTVYMEHESEYYMMQSLTKLYELIYDFLLDINIDKLENEDDLEYALYNAHVKDEFIDDIIKNNISIEHAQNLIKKFR